MAVGFWAVIEEELGEAFVSAIGDGAARCRPREEAFFDFDALRFPDSLGLEIWARGSCTFTRDELMQ